MKVLKQEGEYDSFRVKKDQVMADREMMLKIQGPIKVYILDPL